MILFPHDRLVCSRRGRIERRLSHIEKLPPFRGTKMHSWLTADRVPLEGSRARPEPSSEPEDQWTGGSELGSRSRSLTRRPPDLPASVTSAFPQPPSGCLPASHQRSERRRRSEPRNDAILTSPKRAARPRTGEACSWPRTRARCRLGRLANEPPMEPHDPLGGSPRFSRAGSARSVLGTRSPAAYYAVFPCNGGTSFPHVH